MLRTLLAVGFGIVAAVTTNAVIGYADHAPPPGRVMPLPVGEFRIVLTGDGEASIYKGTTAIAVAANFRVLPTYAKDPHAALKGAVPVPLALPPPIVESTIPPVCTEPCARWRTASVDGHPVDVLTIFPERLKRVHGLQ